MRGLVFLGGALIAIAVCGCEGPVGPAGPQGERGPQGAQGPQGEKAEQGIFAIRAVSDACPQRCTLTCKEDERVLSAYVVGSARPPIIANEQSVEFNNRGVRGAGPAMVFCIPNSG